MKNGLMGKLLPSAVLALALGGLGSAHAVVLTLDIEFSEGDEPENTYTVTIEQCGDGCVDITLANTGDSETEFASAWYLNYDPNKDVTDLIFAHIPGTVEADAVSLNDGSQPQTKWVADGDGIFDILFDFSGGQLAANMTSMYQFTFDGLTVADFLWPSECFGSQAACDAEPEKKEGFFAAAHVQGIGIADGSGFVGAREVPPGEPDEPENGDVPEPGTLALLGGGLFALWAMRRRMMV